MQSRFEGRRPALSHPGPKAQVVAPSRPGALKARPIGPTRLSTHEKFSLVLGVTPQLVDPVTETHADAIRVQIAVGKLRPILVFEVDGANRQSVADHVVDPRAGSKRKVVASAGVEREIHSAEANKKFRVGPECLGPQIDVNAAQIIRLRLVQVGVQTQIARLAFETVAPRWMHIDVGEVSAHLALSVIVLKAAEAAPGENIGAWPRRRRLCLRMGGWACAAKQRKSDNESAE